ncbi:hypothetical protein VTO42DRAFT_7601 [Malbranchea cinnamomea]
MTFDQTRRQLEDQISATEAQLQRLKAELAALEQRERQHHHHHHHHHHNGEHTNGVDDAETNADRGKERICADGDEQREGSPGIPRTLKPTWPLLQDEYRRYGRQMIVEQIGIQGQLKLRSSSVLLVGAGGLGCPASMYLAAAGVGKLGLIDGDTVESSNLHRQVLHRTRNVGKYKVDSAVEYLRELNPHPQYVVFREHLTPQTAPEIFAQFDVILDCTDNPATRYLISDTAVLLGKPLVSASALRTEGQLMILNYPPLPAGHERGGPCYRCVFPRPPPVDSVVSCADGGIIGPVVGLMGVMQAIETIRIITTTVNPETHETSIVPLLHLFSAYSAPPFRSIKLRRRRADCAVCSAKASISLDSLRGGSMDYVQFCGSLNPVSILTPTERMTPQEYVRAYERGIAQRTEVGEPVVDSPLIVDVREKVQYDICPFPHSINVPISEILSTRLKIAEEGQGTSDGEAIASHEWIKRLEMMANRTGEIHVVCRQGNDSQLAVQKMKELGLGKSRTIKDIQGGLKAWRREVDPEWPDY